MQILTMAQIELVAPHARDEQIGALIFTAGNSGLRLGELRALRWQNVDRQAQRIHVVRAFSRDEITTTKNSRRRSVPLAPHLAEAIALLQKHEHHARARDLVFCHQDGAPLESNTIRGAPRRGPGQDPPGDPTIPEANFHDLRHASGTSLARAGADAISIQLISIQRCDPALDGHSDIQTTMIYLHYIDGEDDAERTSRALGG